MNDSSQHVDDYDQYDSYLARNTRSERGGNDVILIANTSPEFDWAEYQNSQEAKRDGSITAHSSTDEGDNKADSSEHVDGYHQYDSDLSRNTRSGRGGNGVIANTVPAFDSD
jgi:hypothetical protein